MGLILLYFVLIIPTLGSSETVNWNRVISEVNRANNGWKAGFNFPPNIELSYIKKLMGTILEDDLAVELSTQDFSQDYISDEDIPESFDSRENWPQCRDVISHIRDQGPCGSCWAVAAASTFSDRLCIASKSGENNTIISAEDILSCSIIGGCGGGFLRIAWWHIKHRGSVTGGDYRSNVGCKPYSLQPCEHHAFGPRINCSDIEAKTPHCRSHCTNQHYEITIKKDKHKAKDYFSVSGEKNIQKEILLRGPVEAGFIVHEDFLTYKSGVYQHITGRMLGGHAVKILGWGSENGIPYWTCANSWNTDWGDSGFFKILRGKNEGRVERGVFGGLF